MWQKNRGIQGALIFDSLRNLWMIWTWLLFERVSDWSNGHNGKDELYGMIKRRQRVHVTDLRWFRCVLFVMFSLDDLDDLDGLDSRFIWALNFWCRVTFCFIESSICFFHFFYWYVCSLMLEDTGLMLPGLLDHVGPKELWTHKHWPQPQSTNQCFWIISVDHRTF